MKFPAVVFLAFALTACFGTLSVSPSFEESRLVQVSADQNSLYVRANNWMVDQFKHADSVVQFADKESGSVSGRYMLGVIMTTQSGVQRKAFATIKLRVKDGAARITVTPEEFRYVAGNPYTTYSPDQARTDVDRLVASFEAAMVKGDDW